MIRRLLNLIFFFLMISNIQGQRYFITVDSLDRYGIVDTNNTILLNFNYKSIEDKGNYLLVIDSVYKKGIYDKNMKLVLPIEFDEIKAKCLSSDWFVGKRDKYYDFYDSTGEMILSNNYIDANLFHNDSALVMFEDSNEIVIVKIDRKGGYAYIRNQYNIGDFSKSRCAIGGGIRVINGLKKKRKYYGVFLNNKWLIEPKYDFIEGTLDYFYIVKSGEFFGVINNEGKLIIPMIYKKIKSKY